MWVNSTSHFNVGPALQSVQKSIQRLERADQKLMIAPAWCRTLQQLAVQFAVVFHPGLRQKEKHVEGPDVSVPTRRGTLRKRGQDWPKLWVGDDRSPGVEAATILGAICGVRCLKIIDLKPSVSGALVINIEVLNTHRISKSPSAFGDEGFPPVSFNF